jgi:hypothetical protein
MNVSPALARVFSLALVLSLFLSTSVFAGNVLITRYFSGSWDQPDQESQGFIVQIAERVDGEKLGIVYWFTYGEDLQTTWYLARGPVNGNEINMRLYTAFNVAFMEDGVEGDANVVEVGTLDLVFHNCNHGMAYYETPEDVIGSGEFRISRITSIYKMRCSGGISDDTPAEAKPLQLEVQLHPPEEGGSGQGKAKFWERVDRSDFKVSAEGLADGLYALQVCAADVGELEITGGEGELAFRSPETEGTLLLTFDPRDCLIDLLGVEGVVLTSGDAVLGAKVKGPKGDPDEEEGVEIEADLVSTGVIEGAQGEAEMEVWAEEAEFSVHITDVPAGFYPVLVSGAQVGEIEVVEEDGKLQGKVKFTDPLKAGALELNFEPRGQLVQILQADLQVILEVTFPDA